MRTFPLILCASAVLGSCLALVACSDSDGGSSGSQRINVKLTADGCEPASMSATAGAITFVVTNAGTASVTEFEVLWVGNILGEVENVIDGLTSRFTLNLGPGEYTTLCPGGKTSEQGSLTVTG
ncbi:MAG: cupredoxin domain-containing protein [Dehalococcoidia bacterium]|nr:cupredoxin domain-containing protein [Dehalococcoidia bacterium]MCB9486728.1 cupredoxin domain-containing protein [Thermoflexaceae bacterium]